MRDEYAGYWIGIDPGFTGAIAVIPRDADDCQSVYDIPILKLGRVTEINRAALLDILRPMSRGASIAAIERAQSMPKQGVRSVFSYGCGYGILLGTLASLAIPHYIVPPSVWKKQMLQGLPRGKDTSRFQAMQLFPYMAKNLSLKKHHGRAEALLLAEYCRLRSGDSDFKDLEVCSM